MKLKVSLKHDRDVQIKAKYGNIKDTENNSDNSDDDSIALFNVTGVSKALSKVQNRTEEAPKISISFRLSEGGLLDIVNAYASVQRTQIVKSKKSTTIGSKKKVLLLSILCLWCYYLHFCW